MSVATSPKGRPRKIPEPTCWFMAEHPRKNIQEKISHVYTNFQGLANVPGLKTGPEDHF